MVPISFAFLLLAAGGPAEVLVERTEPALLRVQELVTIHGTGFGRYDPRDSRVLFETARGPIDTGAPHVWRDDFIQAWVPTGLQPGECALRVVTPGGASAELPLTLAQPSAEGVLAFTERTQLVDDFDVSGFLGPTALNAYRTKDAHVADVDGDGWPDLIDNNSSNQTNQSHMVMRYNQAGAGFTAMDWEPVFNGDTGTFAVTVPPGGDYVANAICYDADFVDLNNDLLPDWLHAATSTSRLRVAINDFGGVPGRFVEATAAWTGMPSIVGSPDDVCSADVNGDGFLDVALALRFSATVQVWLNDAGTKFLPPITVSTPTGTGSIHDVFFLDADDDNLWDLCLCNESGTSWVMLNDGTLANPSWTTAGASFVFPATAGIRADFDGDGLDDVALGDTGTTAVFMNQPGAPGTFTSIDLPGVAPSGRVYDLEIGDLDLDFRPDLVAADLTSVADANVRVWRNAPGGWVHLTVSGTASVFPDHGNYQRLSADVIDFDLDGDLDIYFTGADGFSAPGMPFGSVANQFYENLEVDLPDPFTYCTAKISAIGCVPSIAASGIPSKTAIVSFDVKAALVPNNKNGLFFYGLQGPAAIPFLGGTLCATPPVRRTPVQNSGGSGPAFDDCTGSYLFDFNAWIQAGGGPPVNPGTQVNGQYWFRDPDQPDGTGAGLSDALEFEIAL